MKNRGVLLDRRQDDYIAGSARGLPFEARMPDGDWTRYLPQHEKQRQQGLETMACVSFSAINCIEIQHKFITGTERNFSDRFTAKMSNTTAQGNYLWRVADSIRRDGLVDEVAWPWSAGVDTWEEYYANPPIALIDTGRVFLREWQVQYEWLPDTRRDTLMWHLKHAPIQVTIPGHAVVCFTSNDDVQKYYDSYFPFIKDYEQPFEAAMKVVLSRKQPMLDEAEIKALQSLEGYDDPEGIAYWGDGTHTLKQYLVARLPDKQDELAEALDALNE